MCVQYDCTYENAFNVWNTKNSLFFVCTRKLKNIFSIFFHRGIWLPQTNASFYCKSIPKLIIFQPLSAWRYGHHNSKKVECTNLQVSPLFTLPSACISRNSSSKIQQASSQFCIQQRIERQLSNEQISPKNYFGWQKLKNTEWYWEHTENAQLHFFHSIHTGMGRE